MNTLNESSLKLHIFKIPVPSTKEELTNFFLKFGKLASISMKKSRNKKRFGQAKITMETKEAFKKILNSDPASLQFKNSTLRVERFLSKKDLDSKEKESAGKKVMIFNLHFSIKEEDLKKFIIEHFGEVVNLYIVEKNKKVGEEVKLKRYAMITFKRKEDAIKLKSIEIIKAFGQNLFPSDFIPRRKTTEQKRQEKWTKKLLKENEEKGDSSQCSLKSKEIQNTVELKISKKLVISGLKKDSHCSDNLRLNRSRIPDCYCSVREQKFGFGGQLSY